MISVTRYVTSTNNSVIRRLISFSQVGILDFLIFFGACMLWVFHYTPIIDNPFILYVYIAILWLLWDLKALLIKNQTVKKVVLWMLINSLVLALLLSVSSNTIVGYHAKGNDLILLLTYFPVVFLGIFIPLEFAVNFLEKSLTFFDASVIDVFRMWIEMSTYAFFQSLLIMLIRALLDVPQSTTIKGSEPLKKEQNNGVRVK